MRYYQPNVKTSREAEVIVVQEDRDQAALLVVDEPLDHPIALPGGMPSVGDTVYAMGHPYGLEWSFSSGVVSAIRVEEDMVDNIPIIQATAPISPGNSGGGLFNEYGQLVGICSFTRVRGQNLNFWIPVL
jgi:serine protease Do